MQVECTVLCYEINSILGTVLYGSYSIIHSSFVADTNRLSSGRLPPRNLHICCSGGGLCAAADCSHNPVGHQVHTYIVVLPCLV